MAYDSTKIIKQVAVGGVNYDVEALWFGGKSYDEIVSMISQARMRTKVDSKSSTKEEPATAASESTVGWIYLVALTGQKAGSYTEFITVESGTSTITYSWERIGTTDTDLTDYVKHGTYSGAAQTGGPTVTGSAGAETATGSATITYSKSANATGSAGAHTHSVTGKVTAAGTIGVGTGTANYTPAGSISQPTFSDGSAASAGAHSHSVTAKGSISVGTGTVNYTPKGSVANHSHSIGSTSSTTTIVTAQGTLSKGSLPSLTIENKTVAVTSATQAFTVVTGVTGGTASGTTTVHKSYTHADPAFNTQTVVTGVTGASASGTTAAVIGLPNFSGGNLSITFPSMSGTSNPSISSTYKYAGNKAATGVMYGATVSAGVLSWSQDLNMGDIAFSAGSHGSVGGGTFTFTKASLGALSTATVVTGVTGGVAASTASVLKDVKTAGGITSGGTTTVVTGVTGASASGTQTLTPETVGSASGWSAGSLPSLGAASTATLTYISAVDTNTGNKQPTFTGTGAQLIFTGSSASTDEKGAHTHSVSGTVSQPSFTGTGVQLIFTGSAVDLASGSAASAGAHTHSITLTNTTVTGTAAVAVSDHTHSITQHTHSVVI